jgi:hypothetical protein
MKTVLFTIIFALALFTEVEVKSPPASPAILATSHQVQQQSTPPLPRPRPRANAVLILEVD